MTVSPAWRGTAYWATAYGRTWRRSLVPSVLGPLLYLVVMGRVLGTLVADRGGSLARIDAPDYLSYVAPAIVAVTALVTASHESTGPVFRAMHGARTYEAMRGSPLTIAQIVGGHLAWMAVRVAATVALVAAVVVALGGARPGPAALLVPVNVLGGMAVATGVTAWSARQPTAGHLLAWQRFGVVPMMLFAGVYFPVDALPDGLRWVVQLTPLHHAVELSRDLTLGTGDTAATVGHVAYLGAVATAGAVAAVRTFDARLRD